MDEASSKELWDGEVGSRGLRPNRGVRGSSMAVVVAEVEEESRGGDAGRGSEARWRSMMEVADGWMG